MTQAADTASRLCEERGCTLLTPGDEIKTRNTVISYGCCVCGGVCKSLLNRFMYSSGKCRRCATKTNKGGVRAFAYKDVLEIFQKNGCKILTKDEDIKSSKTSIDYICKCGKEAKTAYGKVKTTGMVRCRSCGAKTGKGKVATFDHIKRMVEEEGYQLVSENYVNTKTPIDLICPEGHEWSTIFQNFKLGVRCKKCNSISLTVDFSKIQNRFREMGVTLISKEKEYVDKNTQLIYRCGGCEKEHGVTWNNTHKDVWQALCNECLKDQERLDPQLIYDYFDDHGCLLLTPQDEYRRNTQPLKFVCYCGGDGEVSFKRFRLGARCRKCMVERREHTSLQKYGVKNPAQSEDIKRKIRETTLERYGVEHVMQDPAMVQKTQVTNLERYGEKYAFCTEEVKKKGRATSKERYGVEYFVASDEMKKRMLEEYGSECYLSSEHAASRKEEFDEKRKDTMMERYGVEYPMQHPEFLEKAVKSGYRSKLYIFPSGREAHIQGYEGFCLDQLLSEGVNEKDIVVGAKQIPRFSYPNPYTGKQSYYFPDIYVPSLNRIIEVKSKYIYKLEAEKNESKWQAVANFKGSSGTAFSAKTENFKQKSSYEMWVYMYDYKGRCVDEFFYI